MLLTLAVLVTLGIVGVYGYTSLFREAASPRDLTDQFDEAGVTCTRYDLLGDFRDSKSLWCATDDGKAITVNTYTAGMTTEEYLVGKCGAFAPDSPRGSLVVDDTWVVDVQQVATTPPTTKRVAEDIAIVLGGTVTPYDCARVKRG
ncbi:MAG: hypothetical protein ACRDPJ_01825 [Nocardioidaceae bacterium]